MKRVVGILLALTLCLTPPLPAAEPIPLDDEFQNSAGAGNVSVSEMIRRLNAALPESDIVPEGEDIIYGFANTYALAARRATDAEVPELKRILLRIRKWRQFDGCFGSYTIREVRRRIAKIAHHPQPLSTPSPAEPLPESLVDAPVALREAWQSYHAAVTPYEVLVRPIEMANRETPVEDLPLLSDDLEKLLSAAPERDVWKSLARQRWGLLCGNLSEMLFHPRNRGLLLSFFEDGKLPEVAGALLDQCPNIVPLPNDEPFEAVIVDTLTRLGFDWEKVMLGSLLHAEYSRPWSSVAHHVGNCDAWLLLAARGSEGTVRNCLELIRINEFVPREVSDFCTVALGSSPSRDRDAADEPSEENAWHRRVVPLPPEIRGEIVSVLTTYLAPDLAPEDLLAMLHAVPAQSIPELREPLRALLAHPLHAVAVHARHRLQDAGLATGQEKIVPAPSPLHLRVFLNGQPLANAGISARLDGKYRDTSFGAAHSQTFSTDNRGHAFYRLDECLVPEQIVGLRFTLSPPTPQTTPDSHIPVLPPRIGAEVPLWDKVWPGPCVAGAIALSAGGDRVQEVRLRVSDLEVKIPKSDVVTPDGGPLTVTLRPVEQSFEFAPYGILARVTARPGESARFQRLQPGKYAVDIEADGVARYQSGTIVMKAAAVKHTVRIEPGRNVRGSLIYPNGNDYDLATNARIFRDGVRMSGEYGRGWIGLPFGRYTLRIQSTRESEEEHKRLGYPPRPIAPENRIGPLELAFVIDAATPPTLDLGKLTVSPEKE